MTLVWGRRDVDDVDPPPSAGYAACHLPHISAPRLGEDLAPYSAFSPISAVTWAVSSPSLGAWRRILEGEPVNFTGGFMAL